MEVAKGAMPFPSTIEALCLLVIPSLTTIPLAPGGVCNQVTLDCIIILHQNKEEKCRLRTQGQSKGLNDAVEI
ncbi:hypothetical protein E5676_scaffold142G002680 [Cucumis melo var. makuwa]|uniref:Uncharacterized protein n=1 Tax=Cucumis melo var. makuwa TaxID=1194695 RepID=A0A5D3DHU3_CUCMM|nr:hypothetical protein E5676_scaffold142G002680 [Cucumis melo var. makuwa]